MKKITSLLHHIIPAASLAAMMFAAPVASGAEPLMRATKEKIYEPDGSKWTLTDTILLTYNAMGLPVRQENSDSTVVSTEYDASGRMISELSQRLNPDGSLTPYKLRTRAYDELTGIVTDSREVNYIGQTEQEGNCVRRTITRNADGKVERVEISVPYRGVYDPIQRLNITYGTDGTATELRWQQLVKGAADEEFVWADGESYTDIVWENTDGQIVNTDDLYRGNNRIRSARYVNSNGGEPYYDYTINVTYNEGNPGFSSTFRGLYQGMENSGVTRLYRETVKDDGSSEQRLDTSYFTYGEDDSKLDPENYIDRAQTDSRGNQILVEQIYWERTPTGSMSQEVIERTKTDITYDPATGLIQRTIVSEYDPEKGRQMPMIRIDSFDYVDCTRLNSIVSPEPAAPAAASAAEFYDLSGRRIAHPRRGSIGVRRLGSKAEVVRF